MIDGSVPDDLDAVPIARGLIGKVLSGRSPCVFDGGLICAEGAIDGEQIDVVDRWMEGDGMRSILCCPIRSHSTLLGALVLGSEDDAFYSSAHVQLASQIASLLAGGIELLQLTDRFRDTEA